MYEKLAGVLLMQSIFSLISIRLFFAISTFVLEATIIRIRSHRLFLLSFMFIRNEINICLKLTTSSKPLGVYLKIPKYINFLKRYL